jgi:archaellum component FlaF (FlaF/FlaG flagellin family)
VREFTNPTYDGAECVCCNRVETIDAINLLVDGNLVWDKDFDAIRLPLAQLLIDIEKYGSKSMKNVLDNSLKNLVESLLKGE